MDCFYINLDIRADRRRALEVNFNARKAEGWRLFRFAALDTAYADSIKLPGGATLAEKACFLSHRHLLKLNLGRSEPVLIAEDDIFFGEQSCRLIEETIANLDPSGWDILFTDVCAPQAGTCIDLYRMRRQVFETDRRVRLVDLSRIVFCAATSYIVNPRSLEKLCALLDAIERVDLGYDLYLRNFTHVGLIRSSVTVPFLTTLSDLAERSSIREMKAELPETVLNLFRKMIWMERDLGRCAEAIDHVKATYGTDEARMFSVLFEAMMSQKMRWEEIRRLPQRLDNASRAHPRQIRNALKTNSPPPVALRLAHLDSSMS